ncbi:MAG TPA: carbonate dehydratase [Casimicrobiaceae bacterium]
MSSLKFLLDQNRSWSAAVRERDPQFFSSLASQQAPRFLWIGCSDSRVPANEIVDLPPGALFVHRNVANVVVHTDLNCLSVLQFAVDALKVAHVLVVGHYGCGGVHAAYQARPLGLIDNWLRHVQDVAAKHAPLLASLPDDNTREDRLCALNVVEQVVHVSRTTIVQDAWRRGQALSLHGWIYQLSDGLITDLGMTAENQAALESGYAASIARLAR